MTQISSRADAVRHFLVMEILERAHVLEASGTDVIHLELGEPDFGTPQIAIDAGIEAMRAGRTRYTHSLGIEPLRDAIARHYVEEYGVDVAPDRIVVTPGSSPGLLLAFGALLDPGDEILISDPGYACYPNIAATLGCLPRPVPVGPDTGFAFDPDTVRRHITPRTRAIVVNSPGNPTGALTPPDVLRALADTGLAVVSDEIYHGLVYDGEAPTMLSFDPDAFVVSGFSKRFAMTGWRLGYLIVPSSCLRQVQAMQQNLFISASDFGQWAALAAFGAHAEVAEMRRTFDDRRRFLVDALPRIGLDVPVIPQGAFYVFADARRFTNDSYAFAIELLEQTGVAVAPGIDFGSRGEGFLRFSYATSLPRITEGLRRVGEHLATR